LGGGNPALAPNPPAPAARRRAPGGAPRRGLDAFAAAIAEPALLERYVRAVNALPPPQAWWTMVANPELEGLWRP